jgi:plasmid stability protein
MASIIVRNLDDEVQRLLKKQAAANDRSMEAEARAILSAAVVQPGFVNAWLELGDAMRREGGPGDGFVLPERSPARAFELS